MKLDDPITVGKVELKNRVVLAPMVSSYATESGEITDKMVNYYRRFAIGDVGLLYLEAALVTEGGASWDRCVGAYHDFFTPGLKRLVSRIHAKGSKVILQLYHAGRQVIITDGRAKAASAIDCPWCRAKTREMSVEEILKVEDDFAAAAVRAKEAGFDGIEIHGAHGYLIAGFVSPSTNKRTDQYGGSFENRTRFPLEILKKVRAAVGDDYLISYRISADEYVDGGFELEEAKRLSSELVKNGVDIMSVSACNLESLNLNKEFRRDFRIKKGLFLHLSRGIKSVVDVPVVGVGRLHHPEVARKALEDGDADLIAIGRGLLTDPDWARKAILGRDDEIMMCAGCEVCFHHVKGCPV